jgi:hypothetical protein
LTTKFKGREGGGVVATSYHPEKKKNTNNDAAAAAAAAVYEDAMYDDACDLGQFLLNPCWYMCLKLASCFHQRPQPQPQPQQQSREQEQRNGTTNNHYHRHHHHHHHKKTNYQLYIYIVGSFGIWAVVFWRLHPLMMMMMMTTTTSMAAITPENNLNAPFHQKLGYVMFISAVAAWIRVSYWTTPGCITETNVSNYNHYPHDNILYHRKKEVYYYENDNDTNGKKNEKEKEAVLSPPPPPPPPPPQVVAVVVAVPRSKWDRYSQQQIPRFDHYCGWLDTSVGEENYRDFLLFLWNYTIIVLYLTSLTLRIMFLVVVEDPPVVVVDPLELEHEKENNNNNNNNAHEEETTSTTTTTTISSIVTLLQFLGQRLGRDYYLSTILFLLILLSVMLVPFSIFHLRLVVCNMTTNEYYKWKGIRQRHAAARTAWAAAVAAAAAATTTTTTTATTSSLPPPPLPLPVNIYNLGVLENIKEVMWPRSLRNKSAKTTKTHLEDEDL